MFFDANFLFKSYGIPLGFYQVPFLTPIILIECCEFFIEINLCFHHHDLQCAWELVSEWGWLFCRKDYNSPGHWYKMMIVEWFISVPSRGNCKDGILFQMKEIHSLASLHPDPTQTSTLSFSTFPCILLCIKM